MLLDEVDKKLLEIVQDIPLAPDPWSAIGELIGIDASEVLERVRRLHQAGYIGQIRAFIEREKLGLHAGTLLALKVKPERVKAIARKLKNLPHVKHVFEREHRFNLWITLSARDVRELEDFVERAVRIAEAEEYLNLPVRKRFKLDARIRLG